MKPVFTRRFAALLSIFVLAFAMTGCESSEIRKASDASAKVASGLHLMQQEVIAVHDAGLLSAAESVEVSKLIIQATHANDQFVGRVKALKRLDTSSRPQVATYFAEVAESLELLNAQGVLHIKNPDARRRVQVAFQAVSTSARVVARLIGSRRNVLPPNTFRARHSDRHRGLTNPASRIA